MAYAHADWRLGNVLATNNCWKPPLAPILPASMPCQSCSLAKETNATGLLLYRQSMNPTSWRVDGGGLSLWPNRAGNRSQRGLLTSQFMSPSRRADFFLNLVLRWDFSHDLSLFRDGKGAFRSSTLFTCLTSAVCPRPHTRLLWGPAT